MPVTGWQFRHSGAELPPCHPASLSAVQSFVVSAVLLGLFVAVGVVAIVAVRSWWQQSGADHGDWEAALVGYKNLRDKGVLSEEEYRKISTLVEPHVRFESEPVDRAQRSDSGG